MDRLRRSPEKAPKTAAVPAPVAPAWQVINSGGRVSQVGVFDSVSAANLESVLRQLADGAQRAG
ncbi:MAG: hypothetical protein ACK5PW_20660 [Burkholderiales bacterium]|jgi:hypothetical protein